MTVNFKSSSGVLEIPYYKLVILGPREVGKSQIIKRFCSETFEHDYYPSYFLDFRVKKIYDEGQKETSEIQIIEIAGNNYQLKYEEDDEDNDQNEYYTENRVEDEKIIQEALLESEAVIMVYDVAKKNSLKELEEIMKVSITDIPDKKGKIWCLIGNKNDIKDKQFKSHEGWEKVIRLKDTYGMDCEFFEISALCNKDNEIGEIIQTIIKKIKDKREKSPKDNSNDKTKGIKTPIEAPEYKLLNNCDII